MKKSSLSGLKSLKVNVHQEKMTKNVSSLRKQPSRSCNQAPSYDTDTCSVVQLTDPNVSTWLSEWYVSVDFKLPEKKRTNIFLLQGKLDGSRKDYSCLVVSRKSSCTFRTKWYDNIYFLTNVSSGSLIGVRGPCHQSKMKSILSAFDHGIPTKWKSILLGESGKESHHTFKSSLVDLSICKDRKINTQRQNLQPLPGDSSSLQHLGNSKSNVYVSKPSPNSSVEFENASDEVEKRRTVLKSADNRHHDDFFESTPMKSKLPKIDLKLKSKLNDIDFSVFDIFDSENSNGTDSTKTDAQTSPPSWKDAHSYLKRVR